jgi:hypothetical protein
VYTTIQESLVNKDICRDDQSFSEHNPAASLFPLFDTPVGESFANSTARNTSIATNGSVVELKEGVEKRNEAGWLRKKKRKFADLSKDNEENDYLYKGKDNEYDPTAYRLEVKRKVNKVPLSWVWKHYKTITVDKDVCQETKKCSLSYIRFFIDLKCQPALVQMSARAGLIVSPGLVQMSAPGCSKCQPRAGPNVSPGLVQMSAPG